ncbi:hypothetical protein H5410_014214 [Solanum commersonii]|uniref:Uncharacterized protein n=1 Tax=Solanum commersonii TaxID=4109 RepID=A0A9J5ZQC7_SOLCO|nr:hypothetical protein H5410_014214 [Solanum commersonii]
MVKPPMATINTLDHDVPSPSLESRGDASGWENLAKEEEHISSPARSKLSSQALTFVPLRKVILSMALTIDNSKMNLTIITKPRMRISHLGNKKVEATKVKRRKKTHERQHSWDGKVTEEFISRHMLMRLAKEKSNDSFKQQQDPINPKRSDELSSFVGHI